MKHDQYLEAALKLADTKRQLLASLLAAEADLEDKLVTASALVKTWGEEQDALWERRLAYARQVVKP